LTWYQTEPRCELTAVLEVARIADRRDDGTRRRAAHALQLHQSGAAHILAGHLTDVSVVLGQSLLETVHFT
jgi:hypothetical protein